MTLDELVHRQPKQNADNLSLEILVHFVDKDGKRIKPSSNRILLPLQVEEITDKERVMLPLALLNGISHCFETREVLHRLVCEQDLSEALKEQYGNNFHKVLSLSLFPILESIEISEVKS